MNYFFNSYLKFSMKLKYIISLCVFLISLSNSTAQNCPPQNSVPTNTVIFGQNLTFQASQTVNVAQGTNTFTILNGGKATFKAGTDITFYDGFDALQGSEVNTSLETCSIVNPLIPNDPLFNLQWGHRNLGNVPAYNNQGLTGIAGMDSKILDAWNITQGSNSIIVAVIDSGLDMTHPDIDYSRIYEPFNAIDDSNDVSDVYGHGTAVTGIIGAKSNNSIGIAGIDQNCKIMPIKISDAGIDQVILAKGINKAVEKGARIINLSLGNKLPSSPEVQNAIINAINNNVIIIAASGNQDTTVVNYPSRYKEVISVGSANPSGRRKVKVSRNQPGNHDKDYRTETGISLDFDRFGWGSNTGENLDVLAPGCLIPTIDVTGQDRGLSRFIGQEIDNVEQVPLYNSVDNGNYVTNTLGTSFAAPFITGVVSLMLAVNPNLKPYDVDKILKNTATSTRDGFNFVNAYEAVKSAQNYTFNESYSDWAVWIEIPQGDINENPTKFDIVVKNNGNQVLPPNTLEYKIVRNNTTDLVTTENISIPSLNINQELNFTINLHSRNESLSCFLQDEVFDSISIKINDSNINEFSSLNNSFRIRTKKYLPDLVVEEATYGNINRIINFKIKNKDKGAIFWNPFAQNSISRIYLSDDRYLDNSDQIIHTSNFYAAICENSSLNLAYQIPNNVVLNKPYIIIKADPNGAYMESNENNNIVIVPINTTISDDGPITLPVDPFPIDPYPIETMRTASNNDLVSFEIFPNPAKDYFSISYDSKTFKKVKVVDVLGTIKFESELNSSNQINIESNTFASGVYMIQLIDKNEDVSIKKLIKN